MPVRVCSICQHPNLAAIDSLLDSGEFQKDISQRFNISKFALSRHARRLCQQSTDSIDPDEQIWLERLERAHAQAVTDGDVRGQQQTTSAALREIRARKAAKAKAAKATSDADSGDSGKIGIGDLDAMVVVLSQENPTPVDRVKIAEVLRRSRELSRPDFVTIFLKAWENARFAEDLATFAATWEPPVEKGNDDAVIPQVTAPN
jgi:hypothetical protein